MIKTPPDTPDSCLFCRIAAGTLPAARVYEDTACVAFLDHRPVFKGHVLLVPRQHVQVLHELPAAQVGPLFQVAQRLTLAVEQALGAGGSFVAMNNRISQSVPHLHVHVIPRHKGDGLRGFFWPRLRYQSDAEIEDLRQRLAAALAAPAAVANDALPATMRP